jgi:hypothetical protein
MSLFWYLFHRSMQWLMEFRLLWMLSNWRLRQMNEFENKILWKNWIKLIKIAILCIIFNFWIIFIRLDLIKLPHLQLWKLLPFLISFSFKHFIKSNLIKYLGSVTANENDSHHNLNILRYCLKIFTLVSKKRKKHFHHDTWEEDRRPSLVLLVLLYSMNQLRNSNHSVYG